MNKTIGFSETESVTGRLLTRRSVRLALIWGVWTLVGLFFTSQVLVYGVYMEKRPPLRNVLFVQMSICYLWALTTPLVLWLARRFRIDRDRWPRRTLLHAGISVGLVSSMSALHYLMFMTWVGHPDSITAFRDLQYVLYNLDRQLCIYWLLLLFSHAQNYYQSYRQGQLRAAQLETQLAQSQLEALKMQLHPHFLLTQEVTLQQEMEFLNGYLEIERVRFQDRLTTEVTVDPEMLDVRVPNLILQPIVENAMRHAIATHSSVGRIEITAAPRNGALRIQIKDNGPGLSKDQTLVGHVVQGVGLTNTKARLERLYGSEYRFELTNDPFGGLIVTLEIPRD